jgi:hypothetical protein
VRPSLPHTVSWRKIVIGIAAFEDCILRRGSEIAQERSKALAPGAADLDAAAAAIVISRIGRIVTATFHMRPGAIFLRGVSSDRMAMGRRSLARRVIAQATTTAIPFAGEVVGDQSFGAAATALAQPSDSSASVCALAKHHKPAKASSGQIRQ